MSIRHWIATNILKLNTITQKEITTHDKLTQLTRDVMTIIKINDFYTKYKNKSPTRPGMFLTPKRYEELIELIRKG